MMRAAHERPQHWGSFPATSHSAIRALRSESEDRAHALETLARAYWPAIYRSIRVRWRKSPAVAEELTQDFLLMMLEKDAFADYEPDRGRFRSYLKTCLDRYLTNRDKESSRLKRGGAVRFEFDFESVECELESEAPSPEEDVSAAFDRTFAATLVKLGVRTLATQCQDRGKATAFQLFKAIALDEVDPKPSYAELARAHGLSVFDVTNQLAFARREFRRIVLENLRVITSNDLDFEAEAQNLFGAPA